LSSHGLGVAEVVELARTLDRLPARLIVYGVAGCVFDVGAPLSPQVGAVIDEVIECVVRERDA
jgi:hydrogenase maturation protease